MVRGGFGVPHMNALFYFAGYDFRNNCWVRFIFTVRNRDGEDRWALARSYIANEYPELSRWSGEFICLTSEDVFKEV